MQMLSCMKFYHSYTVNTVHTVNVIVTVYILLFGLGPGSLRPCRDLDAPAPLNMPWTCMMASHFEEATPGVGSMLPCLSSQYVDLDLAACREPASPASATSSAAFAAAAAGRFSDSGAAPACDVISVRLSPRTCLAVSLCDTAACTHLAAVAAVLIPWRKSSRAAGQLAVNAAGMTEPRGSLCDLQVYVAAAETRGEGRQQFTAYRLAVEAEGGISWEVARRFSDFQV